MADLRRWNLAGVVITLFAVGGLVVTGCGGTDDEPEQKDNQQKTQEDDPVADALGVAEEPPSEVVAGEVFEVSVELLDDGGERFDADEVPITIELDGGEFADGSTDAIADTDENGLADFELVIEAVGEGLVLTATADSESLDEMSIDLEPFDVIAADVDADTSWIGGEDGIADGEDVAEVTIELFDPFGNPVAGIVPAFEATGEDNDYQECSATDAEGIAECSMTSTVAEEKTLQITHPVEVEGETIEFVVDCDLEGVPFGGGEGSGDDPYMVCTSDQLNRIGDGVEYLEKAFVVLQDIDMDGVDDFHVIGDSDDPFVGYFDGGGHSIESLTIEREDESSVGLFGVLGAGAVIEEVVLENISVTGEEQVGALAGSSLGEDEEIDIAGITVTGEVYGTSWYVGGLIGFLHTEATVANSSTDVEVIGDGRYTGGFVGRSEGVIADSSSQGDVIGNGQRYTGGLAGGTFGTITDSSSGSDVMGHGRDTGGLAGTARGEIIDSHATGTVTGENSNTGGLVARLSQDAHLENSYATGDVISSDSRVGGLVGSMDRATIVDSHATGDVTAEGPNVGGLVGSTWRSEIVDSYATGDINGEDDRVGGLVGRNAATIVGCVASGDVFTEGDSVGGLVGYNDGEHEDVRPVIEDSYAVGDVAGMGERWVGGLVGASTDGDVFNSYAAGEVTDNGDDIGGLVGVVGLFSIGDDEIIDSYWDQDTTGMFYSAGGQALSTNAFDNKDNFSGWDFEDVWEIDEAPDGHTRPVLQWQNE